MLPFSKEMREMKDTAAAKYAYMDKMNGRLETLEIYAQIRVSNEDFKARKKNKFELLDEEMFKNKIDLQE